MTASIASGDLTIDLSKSLNFEVSLTENITNLTITNVPSGSTGFSIITVGDGNQRSIFWPVSVKWPNGQSPVITSTSTVRDFLSFLTVDNGTAWYGFVGGQSL